jgi:signal transduction histidine kinase
VSLEESIARGGVAGALALAVDWAATPLGPREAWPRSVMGAAAMVLNSGFPLSLVLGPDPSHARLVYNDAFVAFLGRKHPAAMGRRAREVWPEIWDFLDWSLRQVWQTGRPVTGKDVLLRVERDDRPEEIYACISFSPVWGDEGELRGALACGIETTAGVVRERRERLLRTIAEGLVEARSEHELWDALASNLAAAVKDIPVALLYVVHEDEERASLRASAGLDPGLPGVPREIDLDAGGPDAWGLRRVIRDHDTHLVAPLDVKPSAIVALTGAPREALVVPVTRSPRDSSLGALIVGINPAQALDDAYDGFARRVAYEIATALRNVRSIHEACESRLKDVFLRIASHELRTPLTCFKLNVQVAHNHLVGVDPPLAKRLEGLHRSIDRMTRLVEEMLSVSAISAGKLTLQRRRCDLCAVCRDAAEEQAQATRRALTLDLPARAVPAYVDADRVGQVVANLLSNAFKYSSPDRPATVTLRATERAAIVTVSDEGPGIPTEAVPHIFERFYRVPGVDVRSGSYVGLGLGLFLAKAIVEEHGGSIWVESAPGRGSAFSFSVPLSEHETAGPPGRLGEAVTP